MNVAEGLAEFVMTEYGVRGIVDGRSTTIAFDLGKTVPRTVGGECGRSSLMQLEALTRRATSADADTVAAMLARLFSELSEGDEAPAAALREPVSHVLSSPSCAIYLALVDARPVGVMTLEAGFAVYAGGPLGTIHELYVEPEFRRAGVGAALLDAARAHARDAGWGRLEVTAPAGPRWLRSVQFYVQNGFIEAGPKLKLPITSP